MVVNTLRSTTRQVDFNKVQRWYSLINKTEAWYWRTSLRGILWLGSHKVTARVVVRWSNPTWPPNTLVKDVHSPLIFSRRLILCFFSLNMTWFLELFSWEERTLEAFTLSSRVRPRISFHWSRYNISISVGFWPENLFIKIGFGGLGVIFQNIFKAIVQGLGKWLMLSGSIGVSNQSLSSFARCSARLVFHS